MELHNRGACVSIDALPLTTLMNSPHSCTITLTFPANCASHRNQSIRTFVSEPLLMTGLVSMGSSPPVRWYTSALDWRRDQEKIFLEFIADDLTFTSGNCAYMET